MNHKKNIEPRIWAAASVCVTSLWLGLGCSDKQHDCTWLANCSTTAGGGAGDSSDPCGGCVSPRPFCKTTSTSPACVQCNTNADCPSGTPICDSNGTCRQCLTNSDCTSPHPACKPSTKTCVPCLQNGDCKSAAASRCDTATNGCFACQNDADCSQIAGKKACAADPQTKQNQCVECTLGRESGCLKAGVDYACDPIAQQCTSTAKGSLTVCQPCLADTECVGGNMAAPTAACVPMTFGSNGAPHGAYCLQKVGTAGCFIPYAVSISAVSVSGAALEPYCGINQATTTCEALRDMTSSTVCQTDTDCGAGQGGLCEKVSIVAPFLRCSIPCALPTQCPNTLTCTSPSIPYCHQ